MGMMACSKDGIKQYNKLETRSLSHRWDEITGPITHIYNFGLSCE